jgi:hypothetical protein
VLKTKLIAISKKPPKFVTGYKGTVFAFSCPQEEELYQLLTSYRESLSLTENRAILDEIVSNVILYDYASCLDLLNSYGLLTRDASAPEAVALGTPSFLTSELFRKAYLSSFAAGRVRCMHYFFSNFDLQSGELKSNYKALMKKPYSELDTITAAITLVFGITTGKYVTEDTDKLRRGIRTLRRARLTPMDEVPFEYSTELLLDEQLLLNMELALNLRLFQLSCETSTRIEYLNSRCKNLSPEFETVNRFISVSYTHFDTTSEASSLTATSSSA